MERFGYLGNVRKARSPRPQEQGRRRKPPRARVFNNCGAKEERKPPGPQEMQCGAKEERKPPEPHCKTRSEGGGLAPPLSPGLGIEITEEKRRHVPLVPQVFNVQVKRSMFAVTCARVILELFFD